MEVYFIYFPKAIWCILCFYFGFATVCPPTIAAQLELRIDYEYVLAEIDQQLLKGDLLALRDLGDLLSKPSVRSKAVDLLQRRTLFTNREIVVNPQLSREQFLDFVYTNYARIKFHYLLEVFYITPPAERSAPYTIESLARDELFDPVHRLRQHIQTLQQNVKAGDINSAVTQINRIGELDIFEGSEFLLKQLNEEAFGKRKEFQLLYETICANVVQYHEPQTLRTFLKVYDKKILPAAVIKPFLTRLTNIELDSPNLTKQYEQLLDSLETVEQIRQLGFDKILPSRIYYYEEAVDYYGKIFLGADSLAWLTKSAMDDLIQTRHPRVLYYLAAKLFTSQLQRPNESIAQYWNEKIQQRLAARIEIYNGERKFVVEPDWENDSTGRLNHFLFWASHYDDFEWDENRLQYINKTVSRTLANKYKFLLRRLTSTNDSVAQSVYLQLTEGNPKIIIPLAERYRPVLRNHNKNLPPIDYYYLECLAELTNYCKLNNIDYEAQNELQRALERLKLNLAPQNRFLLENRLIENIKLQDLTKLEYAAMLNTQNRAFSYSMSRILDYAYSKFWSNISNQDDQLRLYLKKSFLFARIGTTGICKEYLNKFDVNKKILQDKLHALRKLETDSHIKFQIERLLTQIDQKELYAWQDLLHSDIDLSLLPVPAETSYPAIFDSLTQQTIDERVQLRLMLYLSLHPAIEQVPHLITLIQKEVLQREANRMLQNIYAYNFKARGQAQVEQWKIIWQTDSINYRSWGTHFLEDVVNYLKTSDRLRISDINVVTTSPFYEPKYRAACLEALKKVTPIRQIDRLSIIPALSVSEELKYLEDLKLQARDLSKLLPLLEVDAPEKFLKFLRQQLNNAKPSEVVPLYVTICSMDWFQEYAASPNPSKSLLNNIRKTLNNYIESKTVSIANKNAAEIALAKLEYAGKTVAVALKASFILEVDEETLADYQESIIRQIDYTQIGDALRDYRKFSPAFDYPLLYRDFGLPIFDLSDIVFRQALIARHKTTSKSAFYIYYLDEFGVRLRDEKGKLDYNKIYDYLQHGIVLPFSGGNEIRDYYVLGIIKLLEATFGTTLDFPNKFQQEELNRTEALKARAKAWMNYLISQRLVKIDLHQPGAFFQ